ncbi:MAG: phage major capsid protein, partial [Beijerinckiaceae bacterium]|nr:phage major capsid protein [Beijerinckiaceae bacterium]
MFPAIEIKSGADDAVSAFNDFHRTLAAFRETNDERLAQLEQRQTTDAVTEEKLVRLDAAVEDTRRRMDRLLLEKARPPLAGAERQEHPLAREHKAAFRAYMRTGEAATLKTIEEKALSAGSGPDG